MKRALVIVVLTIAAVTSALGQTNNKGGVDTRNDSVKETLIALEKQAWEGWKNKDGKFFQSFLSEDTIAVSSSGVDNKAKIVSDISSSNCEVRSYSLDNFNLVMLDKNTAILTFKGVQDFTCGGKAGPPMVWGSSVYVKRGGKWLNAFHQETPVTP